MIGQYYCFGRNWPRCEGKARGMGGSGPPPVCFKTFSNLLDLTQYWPSKQVFYRYTIRSAGPYFIVSSWVPAAIWPNYDGKCILNKWMAFQGRPEIWCVELELGPNTVEGPCWRYKSTTGAEFDSWTIKLSPGTHTNPTPGVSIPSQIGIEPATYADLPPNFCVARLDST